jgi:hypothetical protein
MQPTRTDKSALHFFAGGLDPRPTSGALAGRSRGPANTPFPSRSFLITFIGISCRNFLGEIVISSECGRGTGRGRFLHFCHTYSDGIFECFGFLSQRIQFVHTAQHSLWHNERLKHKTNCQNCGNGQVYRTAEDTTRHPAVIHTLYSYNILT